jgi:hypothetical protein
VSVPNSFPALFLPPSPSPQPFSPHQFVKKDLKLVPSPTVKLLGGLPIFTSDRPSWRIRPLLGASPTFAQQAQLGGLPSSLTSFGIYLLLAYSPPLRLHQAPLKFTQGIKTPSRQHWAFKFIARRAIRVIQHSETTKQVMCKQRRLPRTVSQDGEARRYVMCGT